MTPIDDPPAADRPSEPDGPGARGGPGTSGPGTSGLGTSEPAEPSPTTRLGSRPARRPSARRSLGGAALVVLLVGGAGAAAVVADRHDVRRPGSSTSTSSDPTGSRTSDSSLAAPLRLGADDDQQRVESLTALLAQRRRAVLAHDRDAWLATVDPASKDFRAAQAEVFANLRDVPFADWTYELNGEAPALSDERLKELDDPAWVARVRVGHRLKGYDRATSVSEQYLTVVHRAGGWLLAADSDGGSAPQPWDLGRVHVVRGDRVLVLGTASTSTLRAYAVAGDKAVTRVSSVWGRDWSRKAVLVAPRTQSEFGRLLLRQSEGLGQIAAVTTGDLAGDAADAQGSSRNDRVVINPSAFARLGPVGRRVVLTHEMTHVAVRGSTTGPVPIWLSEGLADYVGYRGTGVARSTAAADVLALVRQGQGPQKLPTTGDFDPTRTTIAPSYSSAWLACALLADTYGERGLVDLYRRAATAPADPDDAPDADRQLDAAFKSELGTTQKKFTVAWRGYLSRLAG